MRRHAASGVRYRGSRGRLPRRPSRSRALTDDMLAVTGWCPSASARRSSRSTCGRSSKRRAAVSGPRPLPRGAATVALILVVLGWFAGIRHGLVEDPRPPVGVKARRRRIRRATAWHRATLGGATGGLTYLAAELVPSAVRAGALVTGAVLTAGVAARATVRTHRVGPHLSSPPTKSSRYSMPWGEETRPTPWLGTVRYSRWTVRPGPVSTPRPGGAGRFPCCTRSTGVIWYGAWPGCPRTRTGSPHAGPCSTRTGSHSPPTSTQPPSSVPGAPSEPGTLATPKSI